MGTSDRAFIAAALVIGALLALYAAHELVIYYAARIAAGIVIGGM